MNTQPDVDIRRGDEPQRFGLTATAIPEANGSQTGVSVENAQSETKQWYVLRVSYGRSEKANELLKAKGIETHLPLHTTYKEMNGKRIKQRLPLLPNILFAKTTLSVLEQFLKSSPDLNFITFYYDHFNKKPDGKNPPLVVPKESMDNFIKLTSIDDEHILLIDKVNGTYKQGDYVRIIDGPFKGIEGRVTKITGQKRVIVELPGLCSVATAYIPKVFLLQV
ncbi:MAG: UpxY family transcription antiterminator [Prevotella sp.]|nr:UpxY family transcription antiterminator [Prevotella sp.]